VKCVIVCIKMEYDEEEYKHPRDWVWTDVVDFSGVNVLTVDVINKENSKDG